MILAIDQGTTGTTIRITDRVGKVVGRAYAEFGQIYPQAGWVEHDAEEIWQVTQKVIIEALADANLKANELSCIGITNQRETTVVWHKETGELLHNAIVWQCRRSAELCEKIKQQGKEKWLQQKTGLLVDAYFSATKLQWLFNEKPVLKELAEQDKLAFGTIDTWLMWKLSGGKAHLTDHTNASRTMLYNIHNQDWDDELLDFFSIPRSMLPEIKSSAGLFCHSEVTGFLGADIPITAVVGDQQAALFGQGCTQAGMVKNTYGTGCFMLMYTADKAPISKQGLLTTIACDQYGQPAYALEGAVFIAGAAVQWLRDQLQIIDSAAETQALASSVTDSNGVVFVPAFSGLGAPYWDMQATGLITGLTQGCTKAHLVRATLEAIAFQSVDVLQLMQKESHLNITHLKVDGGASANDFLMQFQADLLAICLQRPDNIESTVLGATILAAIGAGVWQVDNLPKAIIGSIVEFSGNMPNEKRASLLNAWHQGVEQCLQK